MSENGPKVHGPSGSCGGGWVGGRRYAGNVRRVRRLCGGQRSLVSCRGFNYNGVFGPRAYNFGDPVKLTVAKFLYACTTTRPTPVLRYRCCVTTTTAVPSNTIYYIPNVPRSLQPPRRGNRPSFAVNRGTCSFYHRCRIFFAM